MADIVKDYECCALYRSDVEKEDLDAEVEEVKKLLEAGGAEIQRVDRWNKRMLAYPIKEYREGFYVILRWFGAKDALPQLDYHLRYSDKCLRYLIFDYTEKERKRRKRLGKGKVSEV